MSGVLDLSMHEISHLSAICFIKNQVFSTNNIIKVRFHIIMERRTNSKPTLRSEAVLVQIDIFLLDHDAVDETKGVLIRIST